VTAEDNLLVARVCAGDDYALGDLLQRYGGLLLGVAKRVSRSQSVAEDVLQEVVAEFWAHPERFDCQRGSLRAYLGVQAHRRAVDALRRDARRRSREERWDRLASPASRPWADGMEQAAIDDAVRNAIAQLPDEQRRAVQLAYWHGHTHKEIAQILGIPEGTVKSRLRLAHVKLAGWLAPIRVETW